MKTCNYLPNADSCLEIWLETGNLSESLPCFEGINDECLILYDISSADIVSWLHTIHLRSAELGKKLKQQNILSDICIKPIFLFAEKESADFFLAFLENCTEEELYEVIGELQLEHNEPWSNVDLLTDKQTKDIVAYYLARFAE